MTPFDTQCEILADLWLNYRTEEEVIPLFEYFDMGFPLAFAHNQGIVKLEPVAIAMLGDCWNGVLQAFGHEEDTGFSDLGEMAEMQYNRKTVFDNNQHKEMSNRDNGNNTIRYQV